MTSLSKAQLMSEPPGPRRTILALRRVGLNLKAIAFQNNCNPAVASRVLREQANTELQRRIRDALVNATGMDEGFLFAHLMGSEEALKAS